MKKVILILVLVPAFSFGFDCLTELRTLVQGIEFYDDFNVTHFNVKKSFFTNELKNGARIDSFEAKSPEEFLAFAEAQFDLMDIGGKNFEQMFNNGLTSKQKQVIKLLKNKNYDKIIGQYKKIDSAFQMIYEANIFSDLNFLQRSLTKLQEPFSLEHTIKNRISTAIGRQSMEEALIELGFLKSPRLRNKFKQWKLAHHAIWESVITAAIDFLTICLSRARLYLPVYLPELNILKKIQFPSEIRSLIYQGIDKTYPILKAKYGKVASFDLIYNKFRKIYNAGFAVFYMHFMFDESKISNNLTFFNFEVDEEVFDRLYVINQLGSDWIDQYRHTNGHSPSQEEINDYWEMLEMLSEEQLQQRINELNNRTPSSLAKKNKIHYNKFGPAYQWRF